MRVTTRAGLLCATILGWAAAPASAQVAEPSQVFVLGTITLTAEDDEGRGGTTTTVTAKDVLRSKTAAGVTVIMTTHILEVAERMAERIGVIAGGRLIAEGTLDQLRANIGRETTLEEIFLDLVAQGAAEDGLSKQDAA